MSKRVTAADISLLDTSKHSFAKDVLGAISIVLVALPAVLPYNVFLNECSGDVISNPKEKLFFGLARKDEFCEFGLQHPLWFLNVLLFLSFDVAFWIHSLVFDSTWIVDPYWTLACVLMGHFFQLHPSAASNPRASLAMVLLYVWAIRLTYNYFRREEWHFGVREDWRYASMRVDPRLKKHWWWASFFLGFVFQHVLLFLACLPLYAVYFFGTDKGLNWQDMLGAALSIIGVVCEGLADSQLREFMVANEVRARNGEPKVLLLDTGIWYYSRHPNYFGEQTFWWSMYVLANRAGRTEFFIGAAFMSLLFFGASLRMVEDRMLQNEARRKLYQEYMQTTSAFVPFFKFAKKQQ